MAGRVAANLAKHQITVPNAAAPAANYLPYTSSGQILYISGQLPKDGNGKLLTGQLGNISVEDGKTAARACAISLLGQLQAALGNLDRVKKVLRITVFVNSLPSFTDHPLVANGASDLLVEVFGEEVGRHARCALGAAQLPFNVAVEVDAIVEFEGQL